MSEAQHPSVTYVELVGTTPDCRVCLRVKRNDGTTTEQVVDAADLTTGARIEQALGPVDELVLTLVNEAILPELPSRLFGSLPADILDRLTFRDPEFVIPDILPEGLAVFAGRPKIGKSWAMGEALKIARRKSVLYLALEDPPRRLQSRVRTIVGDRDAIPPLLEFRTAWPTLDKGGIDQLAEWLTAHPIASLVVIDTIGRVRPLRKMSEDQYLGDVGVWGPLQELASSFPGVAIVAVHHQRKGEAEDIVDTVLGSQGVAGTVDTVLVLKKSRSQADGELFVVGRDVEDTERALRFDKGKWTDLGSAADYRGSKERRELLDLIAMAGPVTRRQIVSLTGKNYDAVKKLVQRALWDGVVKEIAGGKVDKR